MPVSAEEKMMFCPELSNASEVAILMDAFSYDFRCRSYCLISYASLPKCCTGFSLGIDGGKKGREGGEVLTDLDGFVVHERVDGDGSGFVIRDVRFSSELRSVGQTQLRLTHLVNRSITNLQEVVLTVNQV